MPKKLKIALVHDYLREYGGAERVVESLHELFPDAPLYTAFVDSNSLGIHWQRFKDWDIRQSSAASIPFIRTIYSPLRIMAAYFFEAFDFTEYDVVISSSNMYMAKAVLTQPETLHICYIHTPPRSLYGFSTRTDWKKSVFTRVLGEFINNRMRPIDFVASQRPDVLVANSITTQERIAKYYRRESVVIYPPVTLQPPLNQEGEKDYYLYVGRLAKSKRADLAIEACKKLGKKLKFVGEGKGEAYLKTIASDRVEFLGSVDDAVLAKLYSGAKALLFPAEDEDFGIVPVEAMMAGTPVIAHNSGGPKETVIDGTTGVLFDELTTEGLTNAIIKLEKLDFDSKKIRQHAMDYSAEKFKAKILALIEKERKV